ncbi:uncharacterized protein LOC107728915 isoform X1 [Sinocyclocheilus rhinocerous]|uniref:Uncharacterized LOC107728915 n=1 Tax=Sinocyclocheilus rhinocerous TaxID=307959 RepID=A0A673FU04_9TELE|nr:PREDICTED: uncharacterized protein LOC107728915 isoform X1 [Sinocyclocheilus rhinocerous]
MAEIIVKNKLSLIKWLSSDHVILLQHVQVNQLIPTAQYRELMDMTGKDRVVIKLLDIILGKGENVCRDFLDLLKNDDVNELYPELREWIKTVDTKDLKAEKDCNNGESGNRPKQETATMTGQSGTKVSSKTFASGGSVVYSPIITDASLGPIEMNMTVAPSGRIVQKPDRDCEHRPIKDYQKFLKKNLSLLVQNVKNIDPIIDDLDLHDESVANMRAKPTDQDKMRKLLTCVNCESIAKDLFNALCKHEKRLMNELLNSY